MHVLISLCLMLGPTPLGGGLRAGHQRCRGCGPLGRSGGIREALPRFEGASGL